MPAETHVGRDRIGPDEVFDCVRAHAAEIFAVDEDTITRESRLVGDLEADSIAMIELVEAVEEELGERTVGFAIDDDDLADVATVGDLVDIAVARLEQAPRPRRRDPVMGGDPLEARLGRPFRDRALIEQALSHRSYCAEHPAVTSNERLEFLGDAVLGLAVTDHVFSRYPLLPEGELAKIRASVVNAEVLAEVGAEIGLGDALRLGKGEDASGGRRKTSILADALEAVIAAVYLDGGWVAAGRIVLELLGDRIDAAASGPGDRDYKSLLQELSARRFERLPRYQVRDVGPDHAKQFTATVLLGGEPRGVGEGRSKKQAEQAAAEAAWHWLAAQESGDGRRVEGEAGVGGNDAGVA